MLDIAITAAKKAGFFLKNNFRCENVVLSKSRSQLSRSDISSKFDVDSDKIIINYIVLSSVAAGITAFLIYSEESGYASYSVSGGNTVMTEITSIEFYAKNCLKWVVDPICGSIPYARGVSDFIVSIALLNNNEVMLGVVYDPIQDELFHAYKNKGAFLNDVKIFPSSIDSLDQAYISIEHKVFRVSPPNELKKFVSAIRRLRVAGTCALEMAYVACGRLDALIKLNQPLYDYAAGLIIVKEAVNAKGGILMIPSFEECPLFISSNPFSFICSNGYLSSELKNHFHGWSYDIDL